MPHEKNTCDPETQNVYMLFCSQPTALFTFFFTPPPEQHGYI